MNEEHNMTLREKWEVYALSQIANHDELNTRDVFNWFLAQFDEMLAEDIEKIPEILPYQKLEKCTYCGKEYQFECSCADVLDTYRDQVRAILEARRLSIKK